MTLVAMLTITDEGPLVKSRKGTVRNTDSFFKDDNVETRKINLTPSLLRDDGNSAIRSVEPREVCIQSVRYPNQTTDGSAAA